jgi:uncharacterized small protein (DUF1192 family)
MTDTVKALKSLLPESQWVLRGDELEWLDTEQTQPTDSEIQTEITRLQAEYDNNQYARDRAEAYPSIVDQLDDIYHNGLAGWKANIKTIKNEYPKG